MIKGIIFDLYGTILDIETKELDDQTLSDFAEMLAPDFKIDIFLFKAQLDAFFKSGVNSAGRDIVPVFENFFNVDTAIAEKLAYTYRVASRYNIAIKKDALEVLPGLAAQFQMVILSNAQAAFTLPEINLFKLNRFFQYFFISSREGTFKPEEKFFDMAISFLNFDKSEIIIIGDCPDTDIRGAKISGLPNILISEKSGIKNSISPYSADFTVRNFFELEKIITAIE